MSTTKRIYNRCCQFRIISNSTEYDTNTTYSPVVVLMCLLCVLYKSLHLIRYDKTQLLTDHQIRPKLRCQKNSSLDCIIITVLFYIILLNYMQASLYYCLPFLFDRNQPILKLSKKFHYDQPIRNKKYVHTRLKNKQQNTIHYFEGLTYRDIELLMTMLHACSQLGWFCT